MNLSSRSFVVFSVLLIIVVGVVLAGVKNGWFEAARPRVESPPPRIDVAKPSDPNSESTSLAEALGVGEDELTSVGGITRPSRDLNFDNANTISTESPKSPLASPGHSIFLKGVENIQVAGLFQELSVPKGQAPAISTFFKPEEFDLAAYQKNPGEYLNKIRPGRVFYPARPAPNVKPLASRTKPFQTVVQGEKVILKVKADPKMPVAFYTQGVGVFDNRLSSFSTQAGDNGIATAVYTAGPGTIGLQNILAASPVHSGQLRFRVNVFLPD